MAASFAVRPSQLREGRPIGTHIVIKDNRERFGGLTMDDLKALRDAIDAYLTMTCPTCGGSGITDRELRIGLNDRASQPQVKGDTND